MQRTHGSFSDHAAVPPQLGPSRAAYSYPPTSHDWARIQGAIYEYYVHQNQPLHVVREQLRRDHGFRASDRMIKARLAKWEYTKNAKREDWGYLAYLHDRRKKENKPTIFDIRGHRKTVKDLQRFIRNQNISPEKFLAESIDNIRSKGDQIPDYIRAITPDRDDLLWSPHAESSLSDIRSPSPVSSTSAVSTLNEVSTPHYTNTGDTVRSCDPAGLQSEGIGRSRSHESRAHAPDSRTTLRRSMKIQPASCQHHNCCLYECELTRRDVEVVSSQLLTPVPLVSKIGHNDMRSWSLIDRRTSSPPRKDAVDLDERSVCSRCDQPCDQHFSSLDLFEPPQGQRNILNDTGEHTLQVPTSMRDEGAWVWVSYCFLACMSITRGDEAMAQRILGQAAIKFEKLLRVQDPLLLTAAGLMITVLHMHDQSEIAARVLHCAKDVVDRLLPVSDPVRVTISYLALTADASGDDLRAANFSSARLAPVYHELKRTHGAAHPYTISAHFNYAWMLKYDGHFAAAESHARQVYSESIRCFGDLHMQTVTSLAVIAGCLALQQERDQECIAAYRSMITSASSILGIIHPYTLEAQRRLADKLERLPGQIGMALKIHRIILFGRATMLGRKHEFTKGQRTHYQNMLRRLNKWQDSQGRPSPERREIEELFTKDPEEAWELVSRVEEIELTETADSPSQNGQDDEWCRLALTKSLSQSRSGTPTSGNGYEAY